MASHRPSSARNAVYLIVAADIMVVFLGGLVIWTLDRQEYEHLTTAFWYILQRSRASDGDVTSVRPIGRLIGGCDLARNRHVEHPDRLDHVVHSSRHANVPTASTKKPKRTPSVGRLDRV